MSKIDFHFQIPYPAFIEKMFVCFLLKNRKKKFGIAFRKIKLFVGNRPAKGRCAIVDAENYEKLSKYNWLLYENHSKKFYAVRLDGPNFVRMHREITGAPAGKIVDHIDGNGLNNTKKNLRIASIAENNRNCKKTKKPTTSKYKGVCIEKSNGKWRAQIYYNNRCKFLGHFDNEEDAARAYDAAAKIYHGEFAVLNFPPEMPDRPDRLSRQQLELLRAECLP